MEEVLCGPGSGPLKNQRCGLGLPGGPGEAVWVTGHGGGLLGLGITRGVHRGSGGNLSHLGQLVALRGVQVRGALCATR